MYKYLSEVARLNTFPPSIRENSAHSYYAAQGFIYASGLLVCQFCNFECKIKKNVQSVTFKHFSTHTKCPIRLRDENLSNIPINQNSFDATFPKRRGLEGIIMPKKFKHQKTRKVSFEHIPFSKIYKCMMAKNGFVLYKDRAVCYFCKLDVELKAYTRNEIVLKHLIESPNCVFLENKINKK